MTTGTVKDSILTLPTITCTFTLFRLWIHWHLMELGQKSVIPIWMHTLQMNALLAAYSNFFIKSHH